jgi:four helix bundle protein
MAESIEQLTAYREARRLEDEIYEAVKAFPADQFYGLSNSLRRSSASVAHHIMGAHRLYSYRLKLDELAAMRREAEQTQQYLEHAREDGYIQSTDASALISDYTSVIKLSWGLTKWLKLKLEEKQQEATAAARDTIQSLNSETI